MAYDGGRSLIVADLHTPMGLILYRYGHHEPDIELCSRLLSPGDIFVDGGANVGLYTLVAAERVGPTGKVIAFEPGRDVRLSLLENVVLNKLGQVQVLPFALSSQQGEASFRVFGIGGAGLNHLAPGDGEAGDLETVLLTTLDTVVVGDDRRRLALIKLDLEGAEHAALLGARALLRDRRPDLILEIEPSHLARMGSTAGDVSTLLRELGYSFFKVRADGPSDLSLSLVDDITVPARNPNIFATTDIDRASKRGIVVA